MNKETIMALADKMRQASVTNFQASDEYRDALHAAVEAMATELEAAKAERDNEKYLATRFMEELEKAQAKLDAAGAAHKEQPND